MFTMHHDLGELIVYSVSLGDWLDLCNLPSSSSVQRTDKPPDRPLLLGSRDSCHVDNHICYVLLTVSMVRTIDYIVLISS